MIKKEHEIDLQNTKKWPKMLKNTGKHFFRWIDDNEEYLDRFDCSISVFPIHYIYRSFDEKTRRG
jgi:hypothetical protein